MSNIYTSQIGNKLYIQHPSFPVHVISIENGTFKCENLQRRDIPAETTEYHAERHQHPKPNMTLPELHLYLKQNYMAWTKEQWWVICSIVQLLSEKSA